MSIAKILVVDDDPDFVEIMRTVLVSADYEVVSASSSAEALKQIKAERPDLMLLDIMMTTVTDGLSLSEQLRQDPALRYLPIVMVTSIAETPHAGVVSMDEAIHMEAWISKPVDPRHLLETVRKVLEGA
jgi:CheY-like chemotaxis protein